MIRILQQDNKITKAVFAVIIGAAVVTMVITLVPGIFDNAGAGGDVSNYATVHSMGPFGRLFGESVPVPQSEVTREAQIQLQQQRLPSFLLPYIESQAGQSLVSRAILKIEADKLGLGVSDNDLVAFLHQGQLGEVLFPNGNYIGDDQYMSIIQNQIGMTRSQFEDTLKTDMEVQRLQQMVTGGVSVSDNAVRDSYRISGTKVKFDYAVLSSDDIGKTVNPSDADLQAFFKQSAARYATAVPETRKIEYVSFGIDQIPGGKPQVSDADIQAYYNAHLASYQVKDQVKARHILIAVPAGADAKTDAAAKAKADDLLKQIKAGGNFAALAAANSDDPGSKAQGGELGFMQPGQTVPEFDKALFSMQAGQTSDVIKTKFGYHIIQVEEHDQAHTKPLADVRGEIVPVLEQQKLGGAEQAYAGTLAAEAKKDGFDKTAAAHGLRAVTTDYLAKDGVIGGVSDGAAMLSAAFATTKGAAPAPVSTGDGYAVFQVEDVRAPHAPSFDEYKSHLLTDYREQQVPNMLAAQLKKLDDRAKELGDLKKAAAEMNVPVKTSDLVGKDGQVPDVGSMAGPGAAAFSLNKGQISGPINSGNFGIVLTVTDKIEPGAEEVAQNFNKTREQMLGEKREEVFRVFLGTLTDKYEKAGAVRLRVQPAKPGAASPFGT